MEIFPIEKQQERDLEIFLAAAGGSFLQSSLWKNFQEAGGRKCWLLALGEEGKIANSLLVIKYNLPFGLSYLYSPHGPVKFSRQASELFLAEIKKIQQQERAIFFRLEPWVAAGAAEFLPALGFKQSGKSVQPANSLVLDLTKSEDELLSAMHQKTRYNIKLATKRGVKITSGGGEDRVKKFFDLLQKTTARDGFSSHPFSYYKKQVEILGGENCASVYFAEKEINGQAVILSAAIMVFYNQQAVYLHGASDYDYRRDMAPYLMQWQAIKDAKTRGCRSYDFWGIAPATSALAKKWAGITRFKQGFGGLEVKYDGAFDYPFHPFYCWAYNLLRK